MLRLSASQIQKFGTLQRKEDALGGCPRAWCAQYVHRLRGEVTPEFFVFGRKLHAVISSLIERGKMPRAGRVDRQTELSAADVDPEGAFGQLARTLMRNMPPIPGRVWYPEAHGSFDWTTLEGTTVSIDLRPDLVSDWIGEMWLLDWKTPGRKKYALKSLYDDVQANLYAHGLMQRFGKGQIRARWCYAVRPAKGKKPPRKTWFVEGTFAAWATEDWLHANVDGTIDLLAAFHESKPDLLDLPGDLRACAGVGKLCDAADLCLSVCGPHPAREIQLDEIEKVKEDGKRHLAVLRSVGGDRLPAYHPGSGPGKA